MTISRRVLSGGALQLSPAVEPSPDPISSSSGMQTVASKTQAAGSTVQSSDVRTSAWDGATLDPVSGNAELDLVFPGPGPGEKWTVERASIGSVAGHWSVCEIHAGPSFNARNPYLTLVDESTVPNASVADESSPIYVGPGQKLIFRFIGSVASVARDDATARIQYTVEQL